MKTQVIRLPILIIILQYVLMGQYLVTKWPKVLRKELVISALPFTQQASKAAVVIVIMVVS